MIAKMTRARVQYTEHIPRAVQYTEHIPRAVQYTEHIPRAVQYTEHIPRAVQYTEHIPGAVQNTEHIPRAKLLPLDYLCFYYSSSNYYDIVVVNAGLITVLYVAVHKCLS